MALPPWNDSMSDGCSFAPIADSIPGCHGCCVRHDEAYYYGGSKADRLAADNALKACWIANGMARWRAEWRYRRVRILGVPWLRIKGVSWAFGGDVFKYTDKPNRA